MNTVTLVSGEVQRPGLTPMELGQAFGVRDISQGLLSLEEITMHGDLARAEDNAHEKARRFLPEKPGVPKGWSFRPGVDCVVSEDTLLLASQDECREFEAGYVAVATEARQSFTEATFDFYLFGLPLGDGRNLLDRAEEAREALALARTPEEARAAVALFRQLLRDADRAAIDEGIQSWHGSDAADAAFDRYMTELAARDEERLASLRAHEAAEEAKLGEIFQEWDREYPLSPERKAEAKAWGKALEGKWRTPPACLAAVFGYGGAGKPEPPADIGQEGVADRGLAAKVAPPLPEEPGRPTRQAASPHEIVPRHDPGPFPSELLSVPGFVNRIKGVSMAGAPYPNETAAFAGALSLLSFLTGRKLRTAGDARTNLFVLLLAPSGSGKDYPRKVNAEVLHRLGLVGALGDSFASAEGIEDALLIAPAMLYQSDEISEYLASVAADKEGRWRRVQAALLRLYSGSNSVFPLRKKAGQEGGGYIDQPSLTLFGTAVPSVCAAAISEPMLTGGFLGRCLILEAGSRGRGQRPKAVEIPADLLETAAYWRDYCPGGDLSIVTPQPAVVPTTGNADKALDAFTAFADGQYARAEKDGDSTLMAVWARALEHTHKLALLYAASENHGQPAISGGAVEWSREFVLHHTRRLLWFARTCLADSPFQKDSKRVLGILRGAGGKMLRGKLLKRSKMKAKDFDAVMSTLIQTEEVLAVDRESRGGRPGLVYVLIEPD